MADRAHDTGVDAQSPHTQPTAALRRPEGVSADDVVVVGAARTPNGRLLGALSSLAATDLASMAIAGALAQGDVPASAVDAVVLGQVLQAGAGQNPARQAALGAGIDPRAHATTVNKVCLSGLQSVIDASRMLRCGDADVVVAGGMESMSRAPHLATDTRRGRAYGTVTLLDHMAFDGLTDAEVGVSMGELTEQYAERFPVSRAEQDAVAARSQQRAAAAWDAGIMQAEVVPVTVQERRGERVVERDEGVRPDSTPETLAGLRPAFTPDGSITAGNASPISDGAAAVVLTRRDIADERGWPVLATLRACGQVAGPDSSLQEQPARAIEQAVQRQGWAVDDLDLIEINEAFAAVVVHSARVLGVDLDRVNPDGGAIALGHPIGASGARLVVHAVHALAAGRAHRAAVALCGGGGQGEALLIEA